MTTPEAIRLSWSPVAQEDLISIWHYGARVWSPSGADEHERKLWAACRRLLVNHELGRTREELGAGMRSLPVHPHVVFYRIAPDAIEVVRVLHQHEDVTTIFH